MLHKGLVTLLLIAVLRNLWLEMQCQTSDQHCIIILPHGAFMVTEAVVGGFVKNKLQDFIRTIFLEMVK